MTLGEAEHRRCSLSSSALDALLILDPPSPILTPSQLSATFTSGDIPIFLFEGTHSTQPTIQDIEYASHTFSDNLHDQSRPSSISSIGSVGTFGPTRRRAARSQPGPGSRDMPTPGFTTNDSIDKAPPDSYPRCRFSTTFQMDAVHDNASGGVSTRGDQRAKPTGSFEILKNNDQFDNEEPPNSGQFSPYISARKHSVKRRLSRKGIDDTSKVLPQTPSKEIYGKDDNIHNISNIRKQGAAQFDRLLWEENTRQKDFGQKYDCVQWSQTDDAPGNCIIASSNRRIDEYFQSITVDLLIDQEGFRTIEPSFEFTGLNRVRTQGNVLEVGSELIQFRPVVRQMYRFHYAPFDGSPLLRRVTINGDETRDYISRQAQLCLKTNGVYSVRGTEIFLGTIPYGSLNSGEVEQYKLQWRFDYMIDDRRVDKSGKIKAGEKTLTPLTFSCSPNLLLPLQGKKINVIHILKKGMATKILSEKSESSGPGCSPAARSARPPTLTPLMSLKSNIQTATQNYIKSQAWTFHRRVQSHGLNSREQSKTSNGRPQEPQNEDHVTSHGLMLSDDTSAMDPFLAHRRRASSAGEQRLRNHFFQTVPKSQYLNRHIVEPAKMEQILIERATIRQQYGPEDRDILGMRPKNLPPIAGQMLSRRT